MHSVQLRYTLHTMPVLCIYVRVVCVSVCIPPRVAGSIQESKCFKGWDKSDREGAIERGGTLGGVFVSAI